LRAWHPKTDLARSAVYRLTFHAVAVPGVRFERDDDTAEHDGAARLIR
jgi:hypothetical protein